MRLSKLILKDGSVYLVGELLTKIIPFLMLPYLTRALGPDGFGQLSYYQAIVALCIVFIGLSQQGAITRYYYYYGQRALKYLLLSTHLVACLITIFAIIISIVFSAESLYIVFVVALSQVLFDTHLAMRQCQRKAIEYVSMKLVGAVINVSATLLFFELISSDVQFRLLAILLSNMAIVIISISIINIRDKNKLKSKWVIKKTTLYIFSFGLPLIAHQLNIFAKGQLDRVIIGSYYSNHDLGIYSAGFQLASITIVFIMALNKAIIPYYYEAMKNKRITSVSVRSATKSSLFFPFFVSFLGYIVPESLFVFFLGDGYDNAKYFTVLFLFGMGLQVPYLILVNYYFYFGFNGLISKISIVCGFIYIILLMILGGYSIYYLPFAYIISNTIMCIALYFNSKLKVDV